MSVTASAPASTANLGPGYDCLAMALQLRCSVTASLSAEWRVSHTGPEVPGAGDDDAVLVAAQKVATGPLELVVDNEIPIGRGIGSSAAALAAGVAAAAAASGDEVVPDRVYRVASELEGHHDQVAAAVYGGLVLIPAEGMPVRLPLHPSLRPLVAVPQTVLPTPVARRLVESSQSLEVVIRSLARMSALTAGLITGDPGLLAAAHGDEIHEAPRASISPEVVTLIDTARAAGAFHAARSGAGPSVMALVDQEMASAVRFALESAGARVIDGPMDTTGLVVG